MSTSYGTGEMGANTSDAGRPFPLPLGIYGLGAHDSPDSDELESESSIST